MKKDLMNSLLVSKASEVSSESSVQAIMKIYELSPLQANCHDVTKVFNWKEFEQKILEDDRTQNIERISRIEVEFRSLSHPREIYLLMQ